MDAYKIIWSSDLETGNEMIDNDHKGIIKLYNQVVNIVEKKQFDKNLVKVLTELTHYSVKHFKNEEDWMLEMNYPDFEEHQMEHKDFVYKIVMFNMSFDDSNEQMFKDILTFLKDWISNHVVSLDKEIVKYYKANN